MKRRVKLSLVVILAVLVVGVLMHLLIPDPHRVDPAEYDNDLTEHVFRFLFTNAPLERLDVPYCLALGYQITSPTPMFLSRFGDVKSPVIGLDDVKFSPEDAVFRTKDTREAVALFQVVNLPPSAEDIPRVETAWMLGQDEGRDVYRVERAGTGFVLHHERAMHMRNRPMESQQEAHGAGGKPSAP